MPFAIELLTKYGEFYPFGATVSSEGELAHTGGWNGEEFPESRALIDLLVRGFQDGAARGLYRATALVSDVRVVPPGKNEKQDAISVRLDHRADYSVVVMFPYTLDEDNALQLDSPFAIQGDAVIFKN
jgi:hypothetical protein